MAAGRGGDTGTVPQLPNFPMHGEPCGPDSKAPHAAFGSVWRLTTPGLEQCGAIFLVNLTQISPALSSSATLRPFPYPNGYSIFFSQPCGSPPDLLHCFLLPSQAAAFFLLPALSSLQDLLLFFLLLALCTPVLPTPAPIYHVPQAEAVHATC